MIRFILNNQTIETSQPPGMTLLDFIRYEQHLKGTKIGCREGDCGACTILIGELENGRVNYRSMTSCITPLANAHGRHVVTIEGLNLQDLSMVQRAMVEESGTQCGFCTPGFVVSLSGYCLSDRPVNHGEAISAIDGNICRCTGYKSIERAAGRIVQQLEGKDTGNPVEWSVRNGLVPEWFSSVPARLAAIAPQQPVHGQLVGGGTDLYVQKHDSMHHAPISPALSDTRLKGISIEGQVCTIGGAVTASELLLSADLQSYFPHLRQHLKLVSSTPIRNMGTIAGNFVNASPIGDLTAMFIALDSTLHLRAADGTERTLRLRNFYKGYKQLDKAPDEHVHAVSFTLPDAHTRFNFEKVSKRTYLDIASVNSAFQIRLKDGVIGEIHLSAGGVGPTPLYLHHTCDALRGKELSVAALRNALGVVDTDISPISDVRGSAAYKRLLLRRLVTAHFITCFPETFTIEAVA